MALSRRMCDPFTQSLKHWAPTETKPNEANWPLMQPIGEPPTTTPLSVDAPAPPSIPDHTLLRPIGRGGYGEVWLAQSITGEWRAVKIVQRAHFNDARPFEREFTGIRRAEPVSRGHTGLVDILHIGRNDEAGHFYYVMELADDEERGREIVPETYRPKTLRSELRRRTCLPAEECVQLGLGLAKGLAHLHQNGLVHRDIKPANIIFVDGQPKLADIGLVAGSDDTVSFVGTEGYLPPEGPGRPAADIYSLGKVLYEIATGRDRTEFPELPTFAGEPGSEAFLELNAILLRACEPDSRRRYATAEKMLVDLRALADGRSIKNPAHRIWTRRLVTTTVVAILILLANWIYPHLQRSAATAQPSAPVLAPEWDFDYSYRNVTEPEAERYLVERFNIRKYVEWQEAPNTYWGPAVNGTESRLIYSFPFSANTRQIRLRCKNHTWDFRVQDGGRGWGTEAIFASTDGKDWQQLERITRDGAPFTYDLELPAVVTGTNQLFVQVRMLVNDTPNIHYTVAQHSTANSTNRVPVFQLQAKYAARK
ncbi:MAG: serine/threonine protein kinase [Pedosphaera sp.]|nr:serine/threonine protein kinase [Pedosphaera sp.]MST01127.1 serine/threonine protein kinase [Pedosphaera sp.]